MLIRMCSDCSDTMCVCM